MAQYTCYYDASSSLAKAKKPLVVVGLLSTIEKWLKCENEWNVVLARFGAPYLHMREFAHGLGPFAIWKDDHAKRAEFLGSLIRVLKRRVNIVFQYRLVPEVFHKLDREFTLAETFGNPYSLTAMVTIMMAHEWFEAQQPGHQVEHVVEKGDEGQAQLPPRFADLHYAPVFKPKVDPSTKRHFVPFQAADLFAYEAYLNIERHLDGKNQVIRKSLTELRKIPIRQHLCDEEVLRDVIAKNPEVILRRK